MADRTPSEKHMAPGPNTTAAVLLAGVAGALVMSLVLFGVWLSGLLPIDNSGATAANARVMALENQVQELLQRPAPVADAGDPKAVDALTARVGKMEQAIAAIPADAPAADAALVKRVADAENAMKSLGVALTALNRRSDEIAANAAQAGARADAAEKLVTELRGGLQDVSKTASAGASAVELTALQQRIAALEQSVKTARDEIAKVAASAPDTSARLALTAAALRDAVLRGAPFDDELEQAKSLGGDEKILAPLAPFAASGVPSAKALAQELSALLPDMLKAAGAQKPSGSFIERLQANARQLVRVRPLDAPPGDDTAAILARVEIAAARADIPAALAELGKLTEAQRAPAQGWIAKANNRQAALAASRQFAAAAARSLGSR
ncbi:MAG: hypothetical protein K9G60_15600 [Pseudolabrys sp.]|nr:hypothetical protein [Pseudolabrys sp.]